MRSILGKLTFFVLVSICSPAVFATVISYGGFEYDVVDWNTASTATDIATGTANGINVTLSAFALGSDTISSADYSLDAGAFGALSFTGSSTLESVSMFGVLDPFESDSLSFSSAVDSVLIIIGSPNTTADAPQYGPSQWDFDDSLSMTVVDDEPTGFSIQAGNVLNAPSVNGPGGHISGVIQISGDSFSSLTWQHVFNSTSNSDKMNITFAISTTVVPIPAAFWLFGSGLGLLGWIRRQKSC